jgi:hypothetical protein
MQAVGLEIVVTSEELRARKEQTFVKGNLLGYPKVDGFSWKFTYLQSGTPSLIQFIFTACLVL